MITYEYFRSVCRCRIKYCDCTPFSDDCPLWQTYLHSVDHTNMSVSALKQVLENTITHYMGQPQHELSSQKQEPTETHTVTNVDLARELLKVVDNTADDMLAIASNPDSYYTRDTQIGIAQARITLLVAIKPIRKQIEEA